MNVAARVKGSNGFIRNILSMRSKKGTTMVEAAVVFPLVILTVITCVLICMFLYSQTIEQSMLHIEMRKTAGDISGHTIYLDQASGGTPAYPVGEIEKKKKGLFYIVRGKEIVTMKNKGIISGRTDQKIESIWTASDGISYVRFCTLADYLADEIQDYR